MITLPNIVTQTSGTADTDSSVTTDIQQNGEGLAQDFLTELGNHLLSLVKQQGTTAQSADSAKKTDDDSDPTTQLNALLAALENPDALNALLQPENIKASTKSADDKDKGETNSLSSTDMQNVQALFAMLPATSVNTVTQTAATQSEAGTLSEGVVGSSEGRRSSLNTLAQLLKGTADSSDDQSKPDSHKAVQQPVTAVAADSDKTATLTSVTTNNSSDAQTLDSRFQQVLSSMNKADDQKPIAASSNDTSSLLTSASLSSASMVTTTPTASATTSTPSTPMLNAQLGSNEWQQALSQQIVMFSRNGQQNAELRLHPEDLGAIQINLKLDNDQAQLTMVSSHSHVRAALEAALPQLRTALAESGINLGQSQVSSDSFAQGQGFQQQQQQQEARRDGQHGSFSLSQDSDNDITPIAVPAALQARVAGNGAVDTFA